MVWLLAMVKSLNPAWARPMAAAGSTRKLYFLWGNFVPPVPKGPSKLPIARSAYLMRDRVKVKKESGPSVLSLWSAEPPIIMSPVKARVMGWLEVSMASGTTVGVGMEVGVVIAIGRFGVSRVAFRIGAQAEVRAMARKIEK